MQAPGVTETVNLIDLFYYTQLILYDFIAPVRKCLHLLEPSSFPIKKSSKWGLLTNVQLLLCVILFTILLSFNI